MRKTSWKKRHHRRTKQLGTAKMRVGGVARVTGDSSREGTVLGDESG